MSPLYSVVGVFMTHSWGIASLFIGTSTLHRIPMPALHTQEHGQHGVFLTNTTGIVTPSKRTRVRGNTTPAHNVTSTFWHARSAH
ncbi:hypothetical protein R3P38DRAFT_240100 [Favolaschia claudopus]|uniref:Secreted protein n=1 Tax=Favolaschia claudopus TaxID=2862362 RepID=A0AAW0CZF4_9AGAR